MQKICILGAPGSGKTFLAHRLAIKFGLETHDLDDIFWDSTADSYGTKASPENRDAALSRIIQKNAWITDGVYYSWVVPAFNNADLIIIWHAPRWLRQWRIIRRFIKRRLGLVKSKRETLVDFKNLIIYNHRFYRRKMPQIKETLKAYAGKTIECSSIRSLLEELKRRFDGN